MLCDVSEDLHAFFVPQMQQLGLQEHPARFGSLSSVSAEWGEGLLWAHSITDKCLFTFHDLHLNEAIQLTEIPPDYICITSMTDSSAKLCPKNSRYLRDRNIISYRQEGGAVNFTLNPGERHRSYTLCMTPDFFDDLKGMSDEEKGFLIDHLCCSDTNTHSREIGCALESLNPSWATRAGGGLFCEAKLHEVLACALDDASRCAATDPWRDTSEERRLAREVQMILDERFSENLTLQSIASELYVGKTRLCAVFRKQMGSCVVEYLRARRMSEARRLLETTGMKAAEIGHAVGYAHASSFTDAFRREFGMSPSEWKQRSRLS